MIVKVRDYGSRVPTDFAPTYARLGQLLTERGDFAEAANVMRKGCQLDPDNLSMANNLAWLLATCPEPRVRDGAEAVSIMLPLSQAFNDWKASSVLGPSVLDTLAASYAEAGQFEKAVNVARRTMHQAQAARQDTLAKQIRLRLAFYEQCKPYHETAP